MRRVGIVQDGVPAWVPGDLTRWLHDHLGSEGPLVWAPLGRGHRVVEAPGGRRAILRTSVPNPSSLLPDDPAREARVLRGLGEQGAPVLPVLATGDEDGEHGGPWLLLDHRPGVRLRDAWPAGWPADGSALPAVADSLVDGLVAVHAVDAATAGLAGLGRGDCFLEREVARWLGLWERNQVRDLPQFGHLAAWLQGNQPVRVDPTLVHGNLHLGNCLVEPGPRPRVTAIVNWQFGTVGDPLSDLGHLLALWGTDHAGRAPLAHVQPLSRAPGAPSRWELADRYREQSGRSTDDLPFYMVLALFKVAAIIECAHARFLTGNPSDPLRLLADEVPRLLDQAAHYAGIV